MGTDDRRNRSAGTPIKVYCLPAERQEIEAHANAAGLSLSNYLLKAGVAHELIKIDPAQVDELVRINGDLGRLGGLLKLWLTDDHRAAHIGPSTIRAVLTHIDTRQEQMREVIKKVLVPRTKRDFSC